jgi:hypothetical protein
MHGYGVLQIEKKIYILKNACGDMHLVYHSSPTKEGPRKIRSKQNSPNKESIFFKHSIKVTHIHYSHKYGLRWPKNGPAIISEHQPGIKRLSTKDRSISEEAKR